MKPVDVEHLLDLAALLKDRVGLHVRRDGHTALRLAMAARLEALREIPDGGAYLGLLHSPGGDDELRRLLPLVTVGKTAFFRDDRQFRALEALLPGLLARARGEGRRLAIWSAGCATGEEPYSIAMSLADAGAGPDDAEILATDVNPEAVAFAARGTYEARRVLREASPDRVARHFDRDGDRLHVRTGLRRLIGAIRPHNLVASPAPSPSGGGGWDLVFCRNVIIYFDTPTTQGVLARLHQALAPGGYLFLGYSESLFRLFEGFELTEVAGAFLYRRPEGHDAPAGPAAPPRLHLVPMPPQPPPVRRTAFRSGAPARAEEVAAPPTPPPLLAPQEYLDGAVALFADGRFGAARELLERLLERSGEDLATRLTLANLYGILRQQDRAREAYLAALSLEPLSAEAHLFYGVHLFAAGQADDAALELSRALFLDPDLTLGHYYLGRCREAQRDAGRARLAYRNALEAHGRRPEGGRQAFLGYYPDLPEGGAAFARAAQYALAAL